MKKQIKIIQKGEDGGNLTYWCSLSGKERLQRLKKLRQEVNTTKYGSQQGFQRVYRIIKRSQRPKSARLQDLVDAEQLEKNKG